MSKASEEALGFEARKVVLIVLFVPSADRQGRELKDGHQAGYRKQAMAVLGQMFGGATAMPPAEGVWRDDEKGGALVWDKPVLVHSYASEQDVATVGKMQDLGQFCRRMRRELEQGEVGLIVDNVYHAFRR